MAWTKRETQIVDSTQKARFGVPKTVCETQQPVNK